MSTDQSLEQEFSNLVSNLAPLVILLMFIVLSLVWGLWFPWETDFLYSSLHHFLTLFPLVLLAVVTYVTHQKLNESDEQREQEDHTRLPRLTTADGVFTYLIALLLAFAAAIGLLTVVWSVL